MVKNRGSKRTLTPKEIFLRRVRHVQRRGHRRGIHRSIAEITQVVEVVAAAVWAPAILPDGLSFVRTLGGIRLLFSLLGGSVDAFIFSKNYVRNALCCKKENEEA